MTDRWFAPARLFDGQRILTGAALCLNSDRVTDFARTAPAGALPLPGLLTPGFVDLQVNGGGGALVNAAPTPDTLHQIAAAHRRFGTVALLPTLITDFPDQMDRLVDAALVTKGDPGLIGVHLEGPHIAPARRGTHVADAIRPLDDRTLMAVQRLRTAGIATLITVAPEAATPAQITALTQMGAVVSLGHSDAAANQVETALAAGAQAFTHLYNAMSPMTHRAPGMVGAAINSTAFAGIICDGHHVSDAMLGLAIRARPLPDRMFLVSDAMATVGGPDHFDLYGQRIRLDQGRLVNADGALAGAHTTLADGLQRLVHDIGLAPDAALRMVTSVPATLIGQPHLGRVMGRTAADLLLLDDQDLRLIGVLADRI